MAISIWSENIHEPQEGEVIREWIYLEQYMWFPGSLKDYAELLKYAFKKQVAENPPKTRRIYEDFLKEHPIKFHTQDLKKGYPPNQSQLEHWSKGQNCKAEIKHTWDERRTSNINSVKKQGELIASAAYAEYMPDMVASIKKSFKDADEIAHTEKEKGIYSSNKAEANAKAKNIIINSFRTLAGYDDKSKEYKIKGNIDSKNEVNVKEEKRHVFTESQKEIINNFTGEPDGETKKFLDEL